MDLITGILEAIKCLCACVIEHAAFIAHLEDNLQWLEYHSDQLRNRREDVMQKVLLAETKPHMIRTKEVNYWLQYVNTFQQQTVKAIQESGAKAVQDKCFHKLCHKNCLSAYNLGRLVVKALEAVKQLMEDGETFMDIGMIACEASRKPAEEMPVPAETIGMDLKVTEVWNSIKQKNVGIIGLYGMGGSGKTTLMKKVNNEFATKTHDFDLVIWVVVSKDHNIDKVIDDICNKVGIDMMDKSRDDKTQEIYNVMKGKKIVLLLDDLWEKINLHSIGVPPPNETNQLKVLFTTRNESVCSAMNAKTIEVKPLVEEDAFRLFCMNVGDETINSDGIRKLAHGIIKECKGLPLALITVGRTMAGKKKLGSWKDALKKLKNSPSEFEGMQKHVFSSLKHSYDSLSCPTKRKCFLYLAMFPEDKSIFVPDLILWWIGEGLLSEHHSIHEAFDQGQDIVGSLKEACLVEQDEENFIKLHDLFRNLALWLLCDKDQNKNTVLVQDEASQLLQGDDLKNCEIAKMISITNDARTWNLPVCPHLTTFMVWDKACIQNLENIKFMNKLRVMRLEGIEEIIALPTEIGLLIHLEYLKLSRCSFKEKFPREMKNLKSLKVFIVQEINLSLEVIPLEVVSCLKSLRVFEFTRSGLVGGDIPEEELLFMEKLELLPHLEDISISVQTPSAFNNLLSSTKLQRCVRFVTIVQHEKSAIDTPIILSVAKLESLEHIHLDGLKNILDESLVNHTDIFDKLSEVYINDCHSITHLTWLKYAPHLRILEVSNCKLLEEVIMEPKHDGNQNVDGMFANLEKMSLKFMQNLRSIYKRALRFPKLQYMTIIGCPCLEKLPLDSNSANYLKEINGESEWWDKIGWENATIKGFFHTKFKEMRLPVYLYAPYPRYYYTPVVPQMLSDENTNGCFIM